MAINSVEHVREMWFLGINVRFCMFSGNLMEQINCGMVGIYEFQGDNKLANAISI